MRKLVKTIHRSNEKVKRYHQNLYLMLLYSSYLLYFLVFLGYLFRSYKTFLTDKIKMNIQTYLQNITFFINAYISIVLLVKFNPLYHKSKFTQFDRQLVFSSAMIIFVTTFLTTSVVTVSS